ncbi:MAG: hypothetical protein ACTSP4_01325 [Candidatus Hodarchaeales archaeon]
MSRDKFKGFLRLSLAHHPLCWHYRLHRIHFLGIELCLGCTGFYLGMIAGIIPVFARMLDNIEWASLVFIASLFFLPSILRIISFPRFNSKNRLPRFLFRFLLGIGVTIGIVSITVAPDPIIAIFQLVLGLGLYITINIKRAMSKDAWNECTECTFTMSLACPGFAPFRLKQTSEVKKE